MRILVHRHGVDDDDDVTMHRQLRLAKSSRCRNTLKQMGHRNTNAHRRTHTHRYEQHSYAKLSLLRVDSSSAMEGKKDSSIIVRYIALLLSVPRNCISDSSFIMQKEKNKFFNFHSPQMTASVTQHS